MAKGKGLTAKSKTYPTVKKLSILLFVLLVNGANQLSAQSTHDLLVSGALDIFKSDNAKVFDKAQIGLEANYFLLRNFTVGTGVEIWTKQKDSFVLGFRWYAEDHIFFRFRGLIGANDAAIGAGWSKSLSEKWRFETIGDFYFNQSAFALRAGVSYVIR